MGSVPEDWSPHVILSLTFWLNSHLEYGGSSSLLIMPGLLRSDRGGLSVSSPLGGWKDTCSLHRWHKFLVLKLIGFPCKPSYLASFLYWIFSLSYPYVTTLYIFNSIVSWWPKLSPLRIPWIHQGWTPAVNYSSCILYNHQQNIFINVQERNYFAIFLDVTLENSYL